MCQKTAQALGGRRGERRETMRGVCCETRTVCTTDARPTELGTISRTMFNCNIQIQHLKFTCIMADYEFRVFTNAYC